MLSGKPLRDPNISIYGAASAKVNIPENIPPHWKHLIKNLTNPNMKSRWGHQEIKHWLQNKTEKEEHPTSQKKNTGDIVDTIITIIKISLIIVSIIATLMTMYLLTTVALTNPQLRSKISNSKLIGNNAKPNPTQIKDILSKTKLRAELLGENPTTIQDLEPYISFKEPTGNLEKYLQKEYPEFQFQIGEKGEPITLEAK